jgi:peptide/nickel transport system ATP-binding protein
MSQPLLAVDGLAIGYRDAAGRTVEIVRDTSFAVGRGESLGIVGESGCGKSTLALALLGYVKRGATRLAGEVRFNGEELFRLPARELQTVRGRRIALVSQHAGTALTPTMRIGAQVDEALRLHCGHADPDEAAHLLERVRLPSPRAMLRRYPHQLSGGQQQRVAIAIALAGDPDLLVLDEPTTGLDTTTQAHVLALLAEIRAESGMAAVIVSHDLGVIAQQSERLLVMYAGEVVERGATCDLFVTPRHPYTRGLLASAPRLDRPERPRSIPGNPPTPAARPGGCPFAPRCLMADARCEQERPSLAPDPCDPSRAVACWHWRTPAAVIALRPVVATPEKPIGAPLLALDGVAARYGRGGPRLPFGSPRSAPRDIVSGIDLAIAPGETLALVGESGSGKSTVAKVAAGLLSPRAGRATLRGEPLAARVEHRLPGQRQAIQLVFQDPGASLNPRRTVLESIARPLDVFHRLPPARRFERAAELLEAVHLPISYLARYPAQLSGGERQRVSIARALAAEPEIVLCDEVVSALDVSVQAAILDLLTNLQRERGLGYLFIAHDLAVVRTIAHRVAVMFQGRLCETGPVDAVFAPPYHPYTAMLLDAVLVPDPAARPRLPAADHSAPAFSGSGCVFAARCPHRMPGLCDAVAPPSQPGAGGSTIWCHLPEDALPTRRETGVHDDRPVLVSSRV